jgi:D-glycero-D-manno-heptose 1,7-bisphosphate phosphatase
VPGLRKLRELGYGLIVVTNQAGIGKGYYTEAQMHACNQRMSALLATAGIQLDGIYFCPDSGYRPSPCRKPMPGMALDAANDHPMDLARSVVIGDKAIDIGLARAVGACGILLATGYGAQERTLCDADYFAHDLVDAADWLAARRPIILCAHD